jgi:predicted peptidase
MRPGERVRILSCLVIPVLLGLCSCPVAGGQTSASQLMERTFQRVITRTVGSSYLLYLPPAYGRDTLAQWPLLMSLHGKGERGNDLEAVKRNGVPRYLLDGHDLNCIVIAPQCPDGAEWSVETLSALLDEIQETYRVDSTRICLTGLSMGGSGVWKLATSYPSRFAAIAPVCGRVDKYVGEKVCRLREVPVWVFHGGKDNVVPITDSEFMVSALRECGGKVRYTVYPDAGHDAWTETYSNPDLYSWFLQQRRPVAQSR